MPIRGIADHQPKSKLAWTLNKLLKGAGTGADPTEIPDPGWRVLAEVTPTVAVDYVDFTGLDINTDKFFLLLLTIKNPLAVSCDYYLFVEGDTVAANYYFQWVQADGATLAAGRANSAAICGIGVAGERVLGWAWITRDPDGYAKARGNECRETGLNVQFVDIAWSKVATVTNITSLRVAAAVAGGIGIGSKLVLCRPRS